MKRTMWVKCISSRKESWVLAIIWWPKVFQKSSLNLVSIWKPTHSSATTMFASIRNLSSSSWLFRRSKPFLWARNSSFKISLFFIHTLPLQSKKDAQIDTRRMWDKDFWNIERSILRRLTKRAHTSTSTLWTRMITTKFKTCKTAERTSVLAKM